jgi:hypothetical protein
MGTGKTRHPRSAFPPGSQDPGDDPDPATIARLCREIQSRWTDREEYQRRTGLLDRLPYEVPECKTPIDKTEVSPTSIA